MIHSINKYAISIFGSLKIICKKNDADLTLLQKTYQKFLNFVYSINKAVMRLALSE